MEHSSIHAVWGEERREGELEEARVSPWALVWRGEEVEGVALLQEAASVERAPSVWAALQEEEVAPPWKVALDRFVEWVVVVELALASFVPVVRAAD